MAIRLQLLGSAGIVGRDGQRAQAVLAQPKRLAVLVLLAVSRPQRLHRRDELLALFWPEATAEHARGALSQALSFLRRNLGDGVIVTRGTDEVGVAVDRLECDACEFQQLAALGDHAGALALYGGDLLDAFHVDEAPGFARWLESERQRLREVAFASARALSLERGAHGDWEGAREVAARALAFAPHDEDAARMLVVALDRGGHRARAIETFDAFTARLAVDLDLAPSPELVAIGQVLRTGARVPTPQTTPVVTLANSLPARAEARAVLDHEAAPTAQALATVPPRQATRVATASIWRAFRLYAAAVVGVTLAAMGATEWIGLPSWVVPGAVLVMALGLPVVILTFEIEAAYGSNTAVPDSGAELVSWRARLVALAHSLVSRRRTWLWMVIGVGAFVMYVGGYMSLRALGIGPAGSLIAAGKLAAREAVVVSEFEGISPGDSTLRASVGAAFRMALAQSPTLAVVAERDVRRAIVRLGQPAGTPLRSDLAREIAASDGYRVVISTGLERIGSRFELSARMLSAQTGDEFASVAVTADGEGDLVPAVGRLAAALRERVGESIALIRRSRPVEEVTTRSLDALQHYLEALRLPDGWANYALQEEHLDSAVALDSGFARADWEHGVILWNLNLHPAKRRQLIERAYRHRDRLTERERMQVVGSYYLWGPAPDIPRAIRTFEALLAIDPESITAMNQLGLAYWHERMHPRAAAMFERAVATDASVAIPYGNLAMVRAEMGQLDEAERLIDALSIRTPDNGNSALLRAHLDIARGRFAEASHRLDSLAVAAPTDLMSLMSAAQMHLRIARETGRAADWLRSSAEFHHMELLAGRSAAPLIAALDTVHAVLESSADTVHVRAQLVRALAEHKVNAMAPADVPYEYLVRLLSASGDAVRASHFMQQAERQREGEDPFDTRASFGRMHGHVAMAQHRYDDAVADYRAGDVGQCLRCVLPDLARAYDAGRHADSALAVFNRYLAAPSIIVGNPIRHEGRSPTIATALVYKRVGELYEAGREPVKALDAYRAFMALWAHADPAWQPQVAAVRSRMASLRARTL